MNDLETAFVGRVGTDPELQVSAAGKPWARLSVAVGRDDEVEWVKVAVFGQAAEDLAANLRKGDRCNIEGRLKLDRRRKGGEVRAGLSVAAWKAEKVRAIGRARQRRSASGRRGEGRDEPTPASYLEA